MTESGSVDGVSSVNFLWRDSFRLEEQLSPDERAIRDAAATFATDRLAPRVLDAFELDAFEKEPVDRDIFLQMGETGFFGLTVPETYGGLVARELTPEQPDMIPNACAGWIPIRSLTCRHFQHSQR